jgi:drug/metabolite transporter (DMT)-like permease
MKNNRIVACMLAVFCAMLWGTAFPFIKLGYSEFNIADGNIGSKILFAGVRFTLAGIMVLCVVWISEKQFPKLSKKDILPIGGFGLVQTAAQYIFTYIGIGFTSGTNTSIISACSSFFTVLAVPLFFKSDKLTFIKIIGCILGFAGVLAINWGGAISTNTLLGDILIFCSTISTAAGNIISKKISVGRNPIAVTAFQLIIGGCVLLFVGFVCGGWLSFNNIRAVLILLWLALVSAVAFSIWNALLKHHPASMITMFNLLVPIFGTILSGVMLGENVFKIETLVSLLLISAGIAAVNLSKNANES